MVSLISRWQLKDGCPPELVTILHELADKVDLHEPGTLQYEVNMPVANPLDRSNKPLDPPSPPIPEKNQTEVVFVEKYVNAQAFADHIHGEVFTTFRKSTLQYFKPSDDTPEWPLTFTTFLDAASEFRRPAPSTVAGMFFEILAQDQSTLSQFYASLFGWEYEQGGGGEQKAFDYVKGTTAGVIRGGVGHAHGKVAGSNAAFYVMVDDVAESLQKALNFGAQADVPVTHVDGYSFAEFLDPEQNRVGLAAHFPPQLVGSTSKT